MKYQDQIKNKKLTEFEKPIKQVVAFSGGKDSTAMLLRMIELGEEIEDIIFSDTGYEYPELYEYIKRIEKHIGRKITIVKPKSTFMQWATGIVTRGENKGEIRGYPLINYPCYWTREAKVKPINDMSKNADKVCIGIAFDEKRRVSNMKDHNFRYPLVEWEWTEKDCAEYLNKKGLLNPLYKNFNRLGCYHCQKQGKMGLYINWKIYPKLWQKIKQHEKKQKELKGTLLYRWDLQELEKEFEAGIIPKGRPLYDCESGCDGVTQAFEIMSCDLEFK